MTVKIGQTVRKFLIFALLAALAGGLLAPPGPAQARDEQLLIDKAVTTLESMRGDPAFAPMHELLATARGVIVVPDMVKAGFFIGGAGGAGVMMAHDVGANEWTDPAFINIGAASFGLQFGAEVSEIVLVILSPQALNALLTNKVSLGAEAGLALGIYGGEREAATTSPAMEMDILSFSYSRGLFGGISVEGSLLLADEERNEAYYGRRASSREIIVDRALSHPGSTALRGLLSAISGGYDPL
jgi:lipid-binding SYLF domain-containing protein